MVMDLRSALQDNQPTATAMEAYEREQLLRHLKIKWAAVNVEYQKLGFVMDIGEPHAACFLSHI
jgi:hypothetical protein